MVKGNISREDYEEFIQEDILPAVAEFEHTTADPLIALASFRYTVPRGQNGFTIPILKRSEEGVERLGEYGRASYVHTERDSKSFEVARVATSLLITEDALAAAIEEGVVDAIEYELNDATMRMSDEYASTFMAVLRTGWGDAATAPPYAGRTFAAHSHLINDGGVGDADLQGDAAHFPDNASNTNEDLYLSTIRGSKLHLSEHGLKPNVMLVSPEAEVDVISMLETQSVGGGQLLPATVSGSIGQLYGLNLFVSPWLSGSEFVVMDTAQRPIVFGEREPLELRTEFRPLDRLWDGQMHASWVFGMVKEWAGIYVDYDGVA